jgi:hypothetical protein
VTLQAAAAESSESDSDSDSDSSDDTPAVSTKKVVSTPASHKPVTTTVPLVTPSTADGKKEKKRTNKEDEAAVVTALDAGEKKVRPDANADTNTSTEDGASQTVDADVNVLQKKKKAKD